MNFPHKRLLLAAALGLPVTFAGCQSRAELLTSTSADSPNRTVTADAEPDEQAAGEDADNQPAGENPAAESASATQAVSLADLDASPPRAVLESAGAVIEFDEQQRAVGVDLTQARITHEVTRSVAELGDLQWTDLRGTRVTDADLAIICAVPQFELIALGQTQITDAGLQHLRQQHKLRFLSLDGTAITDAGLSILGSLPRLEGVSVAGTAVTKAAARDFEARNPACRVILDNNAPERSSQQPMLPQSPESTFPLGSESTLPEGPANLPQDAIDWSQPDAADLPSAEPQKSARQQRDAVDWPEPPSEPRQQPAEQRSTALPAPGEPTAETNADAPWFLDETKASVFPQPLPQPSVAQSPADLPLQNPHQDPVDHKPEPLESAQPNSAQTTPETHSPAQQPPVQISPQHTTPVQASVGSAEETARQLTQVLQERLVDPEVLTVLSRHLLAQQQYAKAARALEALAALQPDDPQVHFDLGVALARTGDYDRAHPHLARVVGDATAWYNLGVIAFERDEPQHSERYFGRAIDLDPDFREARTLLERVRQTSTATLSPPAQQPQSVDGQDLVDLLMSEFGSAAAGNAAGTSPAPNRSAAGITIVPKK